MPEQRKTRKGKGRSTRPTRKGRKPRPAPGNGIPVISLKGEVTDTLPIPGWFDEVGYRPDVIRRAVVTIQANRRQRYGTDPRAGMRHSVEWSGKGRGVSRTPRLKDSLEGAQAPNTVGGRRAHPPRSEKRFTRKMNRKEMRLARLSAMRALADPQMVRGRGHRVSETRYIPIIVEDGLESLGKTADLVSFLKRLGVYADILRANRGKHVRAGKGKSRGRRYRTPASILFVVKGEDSLRCARNLDGVSVRTPHMLNAEDMAPGGVPGRLSIFSRSAFEEVAAWGRR